MNGVLGTNANVSLSVLVHYFKNTIYCFWRGPALYLCPLLRMPNLQMSPSTVSAPAPPQLAASTSQLTPATGSLITWHVALWADTCLWSRGSSVAPLPGSWLADGNPRTEETATRVPAPAPAPRPGRRSSGAVARASNEPSRRLREVLQSRRRPLLG